VERVITVESFLSTRQGDPLRGILFVLAHYQALLKTIAQAPKCIFLSLVNDNHIVGPMSEVTRTFEHLLTQLALVRLKVKVSKCKVWSPLKESPGIEIPQGCALVLNGLHILGLSMGIHDFAAHFLDKVLF
jgi:hypothetical protein